MRCSAVQFMAVSILFGISPSLSQAGFLVGTGSGNDAKPAVLAIVNAYNAANNPDLSTNFDLFKKSDDDSPFVFNMSNGFMFFADSAGTVPVTTHGQLTSLSAAYFKYTGPENLMYYSMKSGNGVSVYTFMAGLNLMNVSNQALSHASFWSGPGLDPGGDPQVPEPTTLTLAFLIGGMARAASRRWRRV